MNTIERFLKFMAKDAIHIVERQKGVGKKSATHMSKSEYTYRQRFL